MPRNVAGRALTSPSRSLSCWHSYFLSLCSSSANVVRSGDTDLFSAENIHRDWTNVKINVEYLHVRLLHPGALTRVTAPYQILCHPEYPQFSCMWPCWSGCLSAQAIQQTSVGKTRTKTEDDMHSTTSYCVSMAYFIDQLDNRSICIGIMEHPVFHFFFSFFFLVLGFPWTLRLA